MHKWHICGAEAELWGIGIMRSDEAANKKAVRTLLAITLGWLFCGCEPVVGPVLQASSRFLAVALGTWRRECSRCGKSYGDRVGLLLPQPGKE